MSNKFKVKIGEDDFTVNTEENEEYVKELTTELNENLKKIANSNPTLNSATVASILALQYCDNFKKKQEECKRLELNLKFSEHSGGVSSNELINAKREIERLSREIRELRRELDNK